ncbi:hypothetical protein Lbir_1257 [Legionella birminghamensis]|uniref:Domain of uncharacterized function (DUF427) n=1 Tax=Legionella birminghamensis TaxID=28083 RepID=A0A378IED5_9GAMM|nr:DUF427 domain-containing protein [Legionella birminghamensis]KTC72482.1 hypothetical protein Lbir_1257 [Legionella birminghamensis]STX30614.1 Domain of uncharacterised function (DUF427) [Legionella birminghamensis]
MTKAIWNGTIIAESNLCERVEGNFYFPPNSVHQEYLTGSSHTSICPWKGVAHYYDIRVDGKVNPAAAWYYPAPKEAANRIRDYIAFWKGVNIID